MSEGYTRIAELLTMTYTIPDETIRKQAEQELKLISTDFKSTLQHLLHLISDQVHTNLKQASATYLRHLIRNLLECSSLQPEEKCIISTAIFNTMLLDIEKSIRNTLNLTLTSLITEDNTSQVALTLSVLVINHMKGPLPHIQTSLLCIKSLFSQISADFSTKEYFSKIFQSLMMIATQNYSEFCAAFDARVLEAASKSISVLSAWSECLAQILEHFEMISPKILKEFLNNVDIAGLFLEILMIKTSGDRLITIENSAFNKEFTIMKTGVLKSLNILIQYTMDTKKKLIQEQEKIEIITTLVGMDLPNMPFVNIVYQLIGPLLDNLLLLTQGHQLNELKESFLVNFFIESLDLCIKCCGEARFFPLFAERAKTLISEFIPNGLSMTDTEKDSVTADPIEFVDQGMDICERQESETIRTSSAKLLEVLCDNIDGSLCFTLTLIEQIFNSLLEDRLECFSQGLGFLFTFDEERKIDFSLLMLCTVSYSTTRRKDLLKVLDTIFSKYFIILCKTQSAIIESRLCMMLYFYSDHLFLERDEYFLKWVEFLITCMSPQNHLQASLLQACETFVALTQNEEIMLRIHDHLKEIFQQILRFVPGQTEKNFFEALSEFLNWYTDISREETMALVIELVRKMNSEGDRVQKDKKSNIVIAKCWAIIRSIANSQFLSSEMADDFEIAISPLLAMLKSNERQIFEEEIFVVILSVMRKTKRVSSIQWEIFSMISHLQQKQENSLRGLLKLIACYITYGKAEIIALPQLIEGIINIAGQALYCKSSGVIKEIANSEGAILLQLLLISFPGHLDNYLEQILSHTITRYNSPPNQNKHLKSSLLNVVLYSFHYNPDLTCSILHRGQTSANTSYLRFILIEIIQNHSIFTHSFDKKSAVLGIKQLLKVNLIPDITELSLHLFESLIIILAQSDKSTEENKGKLEKIYSKYLGVNLEELTDSEIMVKGTKLYFENGEGKTEETETLLIKTQILSQLNEFDEIESFKELLHWHQNNNTAWIKGIIAGLTEARRTQLIDIVKSSRVHLNTPGSALVTRKIVKAKRK